MFECALPMRSSPGAGGSVTVHLGAIRLHAGNRHLRNHRGFSVAFSNGVQWHVLTEVHGVFKRIVTCPGMFYWNCRLSDTFSDGCLPL